MTELETSMWVTRRDVEMAEGKPKRSIFYRMTWFEWCLMMTALYGLCLWVLMTLAGA